MANTHKSYSLEMAEERTHQAAYRQFLLRLGTAHKVGQKLNYFVSLDFFQYLTIFKITRKWAKEMARRLRALAALVYDQSLVSRRNLKALNHL